MAWNDEIIDYLSRQAEDKLTDDDEERRLARDWREPLSVSTVLYQENVPRVYAPKDRRTQCGIDTGCLIRKNTFTGQQPVFVKVEISETVQKRREYQRPSFETNWGIEKQSEYIPAKRGDVKRYLPQLDIAIYDAKVYREQYGLSRSLDKERAEQIRQLRKQQVSATLADMRSDDSSATVTAVQTKDWRELRSMRQLFAANEPLGTGVEQTITRETWMPSATPCLPYTTEAVDWLTELSETDEDGFTVRWLIRDRYKKTGELKRTKDGLTKRNPAISKEYKARRNRTLRRSLDDRKEDKENSIKYLSSVNADGETVTELETVAVDYDRSDVDASKDVTLCDAALNEQEKQDEEQGAEKKELDEIRRSEGYEDDDADDYSTPKDETREEYDERLQAKRDTWELSKDYVRAFEERFDDYRRRHSDPMSPDAALYEMHLRSELEKEQRGRDLIQYAKSLVKTRGADRDYAVADVVAYLYSESAPKTKFELHETDMVQVRSRLFPDSDAAPEWQPRIVEVSNHDALTIGLSYYAFDHRKQQETYRRVGECVENGQCSDGIKCGCNQACECDYGECDEPCTIEQCEHICNGCWEAFGLPYGAFEYGTTKRMLGRRDRRKRQEASNRPYTPKPNEDGSIPSMDDVILEKQAKTTPNTLRKRDRDRRAAKGKPTTNAEPLRLTKHWLEDRSNTERMTEHISRVLVNDAGLLYLYRVHADGEKVEDIARQLNQSDSAIYKAMERTKTPLREQGWRAVSREAVDEERDKKRR